MKRLLSGFLVLCMAIISMPADNAKAAENRYISVPLSIPYNQTGFMQKGDTEHMTPTYNGWQACGIDADAFKAEDIWKNTWREGASENTMLLDGYEFNMKVMPSGYSTGWYWTDQMASASMLLLEKNDWDIPVQQGKYDKLAVVACKQYADRFGDSFKIDLEIKLNYADHTSEQKSVKLTSLEGSDKPSGWKGFAVPVTGRTNEGEKTSGVLSLYEFDLRSDVELTGITFVKSGFGIVYAASLVTDVDKAKSSFIEEIKSEIAANPGVSAEKDSDLNTRINGFLSRASAMGITAEELLAGFLPTAKNAVTDGKYAAGETISAKYDFVDPFGADEGSSEIRWYKSSEFDAAFPENWESIGTGKEITLADSDIGSYIKCEIVPRIDSTIFSGRPTIGAPVSSDPMFYIQAPEARDVYFKTRDAVVPAYPGDTLSLKYTYYDINHDAENGSEFTYYIADSIDGNYTALTGSENSLFITGEMAGKFIKASVKVKNDAEKGGDAKTVASENIVYVADGKRDTGVVGEYGAGNKIFAICLPENTQPSAVSETKYTWYTSAQPIPFSAEKWTKITDNTQFYTITGEEFTVVVIEPAFRNGTDVVKGNAIVKYFYKDTLPMALTPVISCEKSEQEICTGEKLTASYTYFDPNGDEETESVVTFKKSADQITWTELFTGAEYVLTDADINGFIKCTVKPINAKESGAETDSAMIALPSAPTVTDLKIEGAATVGNTLKAVYTYIDNNKNPETDSLIEWYAGTQKRAEGVYYKLADQDAGCDVHFEVTPKTSVEPKTGTKTASTAVRVSSSGRSGGSGGGGSRISGSGGVVYVPVTDKEPEYISPEEENLMFADIKDHWARETIEELAGKGIVSGYGDNFAPDDKLTRGQWCALIGRAFFSENKYTYANQYNDVTENDYFSLFLKAMSDNNIMVGNDGMFMPAKNITREEIAKTAVELYKVKKDVNNINADDLNTFSDADTVSAWAKIYVGQAVTLGILSGKSENSLCAADECTRAEAVVILKRIMDLVK